MPGEHARHGDAVPVWPSLIVRRSGSAGVAWRDPASGRRRGQWPAKGARAGGQCSEIRHTSRQEDDTIRANHNTSENLDDTADCQGHWIKASVEPSGRFTIVNGRNGFSKTYTAR